MSATILPFVRRDRGFVVVEPVTRSYGPALTSMRIWLIGIRDHDGQWNAEFGVRMAVVEPEAWALAGILSVASGLPVKGIDDRTFGWTQRMEAVVFPWSPTDGDAA